MLPPSPMLKATHAARCYHHSTGIADTAVAKISRTEGPGRVSPRGVANGEEGASGGIDRGTASWSRVKGSVCHHVERPAA